MKYTMKKTLAFLLTLVMLVNIFPLSAFADPDRGDAGAFNLPDPNTISFDVDASSAGNIQGYPYVLVKQIVPTLTVHGSQQESVSVYYGAPINKSGSNDPISLNNKTFRKPDAADSLYNSEYETDVMLAVCDYQIDSNQISDSLGRMYEQNSNQLAVYSASSGSIGQAQVPYAIGAGSSKNYQIVIGDNSGNQTDNNNVYINITAGPGVDTSAFVNTYYVIAGWNDNINGSVNNSYGYTGPIANSGLANEHGIVVPDYASTLAQNPDKTLFVGLKAYYPGESVGDPRGYEGHALAGSPYPFNTNCTVNETSANKTYNLAFSGPTTDNDGTRHYTIEITDPNYQGPTEFSTELSFTEGGTAAAPAALSDGFYLVAKDSDNNYYYAPVTASGIGDFVYPEGHELTDNKIPEAEELKFVQYAGEALAAVLSELEALEALDDYVITYPTEPTNGVYQFTANKPVPCTVTISFVDADDQPDETPALDAGYTYSVVAYNNGTEAGSASFTGTGDLTFPEGTVINDTTTFKIRRVKDETTEEIASGGKFGLYTFDWGAAANTVYTITAQKDRIYTASLSFSPDEDITLGDDPYYVLVKGDNNQYKYYALVTDLGFDSFRDATGAVVTGMNGITGFEFVNAAAVTVNSISDLTGLAKINDGGTIGEYYTISIPAEPTDTVYEFSATKQQNKYYMQYQSSDGNSIEGITLRDGTCYYLLASIDGTPAYYAALPGESYGDNPNPITFNTSDTNTTTYTLPNVSFAIKQSDSEAAGLQDVIGASEVLQIFDASGKKYALTYTTPHNRAVPPSEFDIIAKQVADENSVIIDFINNGRPDTNVTLSGNYYLVLKDNYNNKYYAPITVVGSQAVIHDFKNANNNGEAYTIPTDAATITYGKILKNSGSGEPSAQMIRDSYDSGSSQITTASTCSDGDSLELYDLTFDNQRANDQSFHITATKKVGYEVTVNFKNSDMSEPVTPGEGDAPAITESSWIRAGLFNGDSAEGRIGFAYASIQTSASTNYAILDTFTLDSGGTISYTDAKAAGYYVDGIRLIHSPYTTNAPTQYTDTSYSEADFDGYTFVYNRRNNWVDKNNKGDPKTATSNEILIRTSDPTEYHVKLDCGENGLTIPDGYDLYAKVTIDYQSNVNGYGFAKITNSDSHDGGKTFDVVISEWYDQQGAPVPGETISGHEMQMSVQLHVLPSNSPATHPGALTTGYDGNVMKIGDTVQTHTVVSYPVVQKDYVYDETAENPPRIIENIPGVKQVITDVVYLDVPNDHFKLYSLEDVLDGGYNVVTLCYGPKGDEEFGENVGQGDAYIAKHQMGAVLIRGDLDIDENGDVSGLADSYDAINPSVVGGKMDNPNAGITGPFIHSRPTEYRQMLNKYGADTIVNMYLGSKNNVIGYYVNDQRHYAQDGGKDYGFNRAGATIISDDFVDWNRLQKNIVNASKSMAVNARDTVTPNDNGVVNVSPGDNIIVDITPGQQITINLVIPEGNTTPFEDLPGTVINFTGNDETMYVPYLTVNGDTLTTVENGKGISVVYNYPNCTHTVHSPFNGESEFGHVVAPKALIKFEGGNYSGTLIGNNAYIGSSAEGHLYPYNGGVLVGVYAEVDFGKILNDAAPTTQVFTFHMDRFEDTATAGEYNTNGDDAFWENEQNPKNSNGTIEFADIAFFNAGTYYFRIYEDTSVQKTGLTYDTTQYLMKVTIKSRIEIVNNISKTVLYIDKDGTQLYKVAEGKEDQLLTVSTDDTDPDNIIKIADIDIDSLLDANTISIVDGIEWGNDTTLHSNKSFVNTMEDIDIAVPLTGTKSLEGKALEGNDFTFRVLDQNDNVVSTGKNNSSGTITFTPIGYKSDSVFAAGDTATEKTFTYKVVEVIPEGANEGNHYTYDGIRYDPSEKTIQVKVTRVFDETLGMWGDYQATLVQGLDSQEFENTYTGTLGSVQVTKAFSGVDNLPDNFQIVATYTVEGTEQSKVLTLGTDSEIAHTGTGSTTDPYTWTITDLPINTEVTFEESGILVDGYALKVNSTATMVDSATVKATVSGTEVATGALINAYERKTGTAAPEITKKMEGPDAKEAPDGTYEFKLTGLEQAPMPESDTVTVKLTKGMVEETAAFGEITYDTVGTYQYEITEVPGDVVGMTYASGSIKVTVTVTEGDTELETKVEYEDGINSLVNTYDKPDQPTFEKKIKDTNDTTGETSDWQDSADYDIGDSVPYRLKAKLASNVTDYRKYHITFHDTLEKGLTFEKIDSVTVNGNALPENGYTFKKISDQQFDLTVTFNDGNSQITDESLNNGIVEVLFTAVLNEDAVIGGHGNVNKAQLEYSCNPKLDQEGKPSEDTETTEWDFVICFTYKVDVNKVDQDGNALKGAEFKLEKVLKDGTKKEIACVTADSGTGFSFNGLDDGDYILTETKIPEGYQGIQPVTFTVTAKHEVTWTKLEGRDDVLTELTGKVPSGEITFTVDKEKGSLTADVKNEADTTSATVKKVWADDNNRDGIRQLTLKVKLLADGQETGQYVTLSESNNWCDSISGLTKEKDGKDIVYTWKEDGAAGYTLKSPVTAGTLTILTNTHEAEETEVKVKKVWIDDGRKHLDGITVILYADGKLADTTTLSEANGWQDSWKHLKKNINDKGQSREIKYTVAEAEIPEGYVAKITGSASTGFVITNTLQTGSLVIEKTFDIREPEEKPEEEEQMTEIEVQKIWVDNDNEDGNRPESITVHLYAGGTEIKTAKLTAQNGWKRKFGDLPKFVDGHPIKYSITEDPVECYVTEIHGFTITNRYVPELMSVSVRKVWNDEDNKQQKRPLSIWMKLSNGMSVILNEANGWSATITGLPARVNGKPAVYTWTEQSVAGYELESKVTEGSTTVFTNRLWTRPDEPEAGRTPKTPGDTWYVFEEYDTPLGVEVIINHVGDCFD